MQSARGTVVGVVVGLTVVVVVDVEITPASETRLLQPPSTPLSITRARYTVVEVPVLS